MIQIWQNWISTRHNNLTQTTVSLKNIFENVNCEMSDQCQASVFVHTRVFDILLPVNARVIIDTPTITFISVSIHVSSPVIQVDDDPGAKSSHWSLKTSRPLIYLPTPWWSAILLAINHLCFDTNTYRGFNTLRPRQNGRHFADDIFKRIFIN